MEFKEANKEFLPIATQLFEEHKERLHLTVEPTEVMFLRSDSKKKAYAYVKRVTDEYTLLTDKKYFMVIVTRYFDILKTDAQKRYVILHEMMHLFKNENDQYKMLDHNLKEFRELLQNPEWNLLLVDGGNEVEETPDGEIKIGLDFDFHNKQAVSELNKKLKEKSKESEEPETEEGEDNSSQKSQ
mgnify:CR=1 FL=1